MDAKRLTWYVLTIALAGAAVVGSAARSTRELMNAGMAVGTPDLKSAGVMTFGPDNMLFLGDSVGGAVFALDVADTGRDDAIADFEVKQIDRKIAALLGTAPDDIVIRDLVVHKPSQHMYLSVSRGRGSDAQPVLIRVSRSGELAEIGLTQIRFAKATLQDMPAPDAKTAWGASARGMAITDLAVEGDELFVAGLSNEQFSSALRRVPVPFSSNARTTTLEIFHTSHNQYQTNAPIETFLPMTVRSKRVMLAGYGCSPLALFAMDDLRREKHLRGTTVAELGGGNRPSDMVEFDRDGDRVVIVANSDRTLMRLTGRDLDKSEPLTHGASQAYEAFGTPYLAIAVVGVTQLDDLNREQVVVIQRDIEDGSLNLKSLQKKWL
jgi:hypothetical protein